MSDASPPDAAGLLAAFRAALGDAAVASYGLAPDDPRAARALARVQSAHADLARLGVDPGPAVDAVADDTGLRIQSFLAECLRGPATIPGVHYAPDAVRASHGQPLRGHLLTGYQCESCSTVDVPARACPWLCTACRAAAADALRRRGATLHLDAARFAPDALAALPAEERAGRLRELEAQLAAGLGPSTDLADFQSVLRAYVAQLSTLGHALYLWDYDGEDHEWGVGTARAVPVPPRGGAQVARCQWVRERRPCASP